MRRALPPYHVPRRNGAWEACREKLGELGELGVPCAMGVESRRILFETIQYLEPTDILDIGTYVGTSALLFALAAPLARVVTVDIREQNGARADGSQPFWQQVSRQRSPRDLMAAAGVADRVEFVLDDSIAYMQGTKRRFDLISIDGYHSVEQVAAEVPLAASVLKPDGLIFLDDIQPPGFSPPSGIDVITGPYKGLQLALAAAPGRFVPHYVATNLDGSKNAVAFLTAGP